MVEHPERVYLWAGPPTVMQERPQNRREVFELHRLGLWTLGLLRPGKPGWKGTPPPKRSVSLTGGCSKKGTSNGCFSSLRLPPLPLPRESRMWDAERRSLGHQPDPRQRDGRRWDLLLSPYLLLCALEVESLGRELTENQHRVRRETRQLLRLLLSSTRLLFSIVH